MILEEGGAICMIFSDLVVMMYFGHKYYRGTCWQHLQLGNGQIM